MNKNVGFTLLEILITIVIIGVLASVSITNYTSAVERSRGAEAMEVLLKCYAGYHRLIIDGETINAGLPLSWARMGMSDPNAPSNRLFNYSIRPNTVSPNRINASTVRTSPRTGCWGRQIATVWISIDLNNGTITSTNPY